MRRVLSTVAWLGRVVGHLMVSQPIVTVSSIFLGLIGHIATVLAFLLPLKVILLAGAGGIPKYFRPFIGQEDKPVAIVVLSIGSVLCYVLSIYLDSFVSRLSAKGSQRILENANSVAIVNNQGDETSDIFLRFVQLCTGFLFVAVVIGVLAWLNPLLFGCVSAGMVASFLYLVYDAPSDEIDKESRKGIGNKLSVLTSLIFFGCFAVVLMPFVLSLPGRNILVAIISFVLLRRVLSILPKLVRQSIKMATDRPLISALIFPDYQMPRHEAKEGRTFRETFEKRARVTRVRGELERAGLIADGARLDVVWVDPDSRDFQSFEARVVDHDGGSQRLFLKRVISPSREILAENERFLFDNLPRPALKAPPLVASYKEGDFDCLISDIGPVTDETEADESTVAGLLEHCWALDPGEKLVTAYRASHEVLDERLTEKLVSRAGVAVDTDEEAEGFEAFRATLTRFRRELRKIPLYVCNEHLDESHVYVRADGEAVVTSWGRWSLEPMGAVLPDGDSDKALADRLERVRLARPTMPKRIGVAHLRLAENAFELERQLEKGMFKKALSTMAVLVASPLLAEEADAGPSEAPLAKQRPKTKATRKSRRRVEELDRGRGLPVTAEGEG